MKLKLILFLLVVTGSHAWAQSKNSISIVYGTAANGIDIHGANIDFSYSGEGGTIFGLNYQRNFSSLFSLETGLLFTNDNIQSKVNDEQIYNIQYNVPIYVTTPYNIKMLSVPVLMKFTLFKYFFIDGGFLTEFQTNYSYEMLVSGTSTYPSSSEYQANPTNNAIVNEQSGIGLELGGGVKYNFGPLLISVNPYLQEHDFIQFNSSSNNGNYTRYSLYDRGCKFGASYRF